MLYSHPALAQPQYEQAILASKPLRYYRNAPVSGTWRDLCGTADATIVGTPTRTRYITPPGIPDGGGFQTATGSGGYATAGTAAAPSTALTLAAWTFITAQPNPDAGIFGNWQGGTGGVMIYKPNSTAIIMLQNSTSATSGAVSLNAWHFVVGTWDGTHIRLYIDGVLAAGPTAISVAPAGTITWCLNTYSVSGNPANRIIAGTTAEHALWPRALPLGEIAYFHALGRGN